MNDLAPRRRKAPRIVDERSHQVALRIRRARLSRGWTVDRLRREMELIGYPIAHSTIYRREISGASRMTLGALFAFAEVLKVPVMRLLVGPVCQVCDDNPPPGFICTSCHVRPEQNAA